MKCAQCGESFDAPTAIAEYCSPECAAAAEVRYDLAQKPMPNRRLHRRMLRWETTLREMGLLKPHETKDSMPFEQFLKRIEESMEMMEDAREVREALDPRRR